jgi:hypothetical protein
MSHPDTTFPNPEWPLLPDYETRFYANVDNRVERHYPNGRVKHVPIQVPTAMFTFLKDVLHVDPSEEVTMYVVQDGKYYIFGLAWGSADTNVADLWFYSPASLPAIFK